MAVTIVSQKFYEQLQNGSSFATWPLFTIGERLLINTEVEVYTEITFTAASTLISGNAANVNKLYNNGGKFASISVGDTIKIVDGSGFFATVNNQKFTVLQKFSNNQILVSNAIVSGSPIPSGINTSTAIIYNLTEVTGMELNFNFIENSEPNNYLSKIDNSFQSLKATAVQTATFGSPRFFVEQGGTEWRISPSMGMASSIVRTSYDATNGKQKFLIRHNTIVTPLFLATQYADFQNLIAPQYFSNGNCLKYAIKVSAYSNILNPNTIQSVESVNSLIGESGWFNEVYNGGPKNYDIANVVFKQWTQTITNILLQPGFGQSIEFDITSDGSDFVAGQRISIGLMKLPNNASEYQNNGRYFTQNFLYINLAGPADNSLNGPLYSATGNYNFLQSWKANVTSANNIHVVINLGFTNDVINVLNESTIPRFTFWAMLASASGPASSVETQNKQAIYKDAYNFNKEVIPADTGIIQTFKRHYEDATDAGITGLVTTFKNDECVMVSNIYGTWVENPTTIDEITPTKFACQLVAKKSDGTEFILEDWQLPVNMIYQSGVPVINFTNNRVFRIPNAEIRKAITIEVVTIGSSNYQFKINYPFMIRWEDWVQLIGANSDFYNPSQLNNGLNQDWEHYLTSDWEIYFRTGYDVVSSVGPYHFEKDLLIPINNYATNPDYITKNVESFTTAGTQLLSTGVNYIQANQNTVIKATFEKTGGLDKDDCRVVFGIEIKQQGGIGGRVRYSSVWETGNPLTWFVPFSGSINKVLISQITADKVEAKATIDFSLLPQGNITYTIVARLYEVPAPIKPEDYKKMSDDTYKLMSSGVLKIIS